MEDTSYMEQWRMNSLDQFGILPQVTAFGQPSQHSLQVPSSSIHASLSTSQNGYDDSHTSQLKTSMITCKPELVSTSPAPSSLSILSFEDPNYRNKPSTVKLEEMAKSRSIGSLPFGLFTQGLLGEDNYAFKEYPPTKRISSGASRFAQNQDHIMAERKRRERLSQRFIALSAMVPGLKKTDKASVLGDTIKYLKQLQERVKALEEQTKKKTMESVVFVKKSQLFADDDDNSSSDGNFFSGPSAALPEIEARFCEKNVLIRIHCEKRRGVLEKTISEIERLALTVVNSNAMTFGSSVLDITIIAQMNADFCLSVTDLAKKVRSALESFI